MRQPKSWATCRGCGETRWSVHRRGLCTACYERSRPRERRAVATCQGCGRTRLAYHRRGLCPACYERRRYRSFTCATCRAVVEAPASFAALGTCPRCHSRERVASFHCPACGVTRVTRSQGGVCPACARRRQIRVATCRLCGQTRKAVFNKRDDVCHACLSDAAARRSGLPRARPAETQEAFEARLLGRLAPLRGAWVRQFLATAYRDHAPKTRRGYLAVLARFDAHLTAATPVGAGQWTLVTPAQVEGFLAVRGRFRLEVLRVFFAWLHARKGCAALAEVLPRAPRRARLRVLPVGEVFALYRRWIGDTAPPAEALAGLLVLLHCLTNGELRHLRLADVLGPERLLVCGRVLDLAAPVIPALARYRAWRAEWYGGPSTYLLVSEASRLHDRPVSAQWFQGNPAGVRVADLRQSAIQRLVQGLGCDGLQLAAYTNRSIQAAQEYLKLFGAPMPPAPSPDG